MGQRNGIGWINPRYVAKVSGSPAELMLAAATELHARWKDGGWNDTVEDVIAAQQTLALLGELLGDDKLMSAFVVELREAKAVSKDAADRVQKAGWAAGNAARDITYALGHVSTDAGLRKALVERGL
jgi:hypothetical protein